jgi:DNA-binding transcriptional regulator YhcF (GntR family)
MYCYNDHMLAVHIDANSEVPPNEQVRTQLRDAIVAAQILPDEPLPTVRQLAADLGLTVNTVAKAYRELGLVEILRHEAA